LSGQGFLNNNDINATAVCIEVSQIEPLVVEVKVHWPFWEFVLLDSERVLKKPSKTDVKARTLVHLAFKSFKLDIPFDIRDPSGKAIDALSEVLYKSHIDKIEKMKDWILSPFWYMAVEKKAGSFILKQLALILNCSNCHMGRANKQCKNLLCKKCCIGDDSISTCVTHGKKPPE
jgi:hypothetical protein